MEIWKELKKCSESDQPEDRMFFARAIKSIIVMLENLSDKEMNLAMLNEYKKILEEFEIYKQIKKEN